MRYQVENKTIREIWDSSPTWKIENKDYLNFLDVLNNEMKPLILSFPHFAKRYCPELWDMTPSNAIKHVKKICPAIVGRESFKN